MKNTFCTTRKSIFPIIMSSCLLTACASLFPSKDAEDISSTVEQAPSSSAKPQTEEHLAQQISSLQQQVSGLQQSIQNLLAQQNQVATNNTQAPRLNNPVSQKMASNTIVESEPEPQPESKISAWGYKLSTNLSSVMIVDTQEAQQVVAVATKPVPSPVSAKVAQKQKLTVFPMENQEDINFVFQEPVREVASLTTERQHLKVPQTLDDVEKEVKNLGESITVHDDFIVFRISFDHGGSALSLSPAFKAQLLQAARETKYIDIQGLTDSDQPTRNSERIAAARAQSAYDLLVQNGVNSEKISLSSRGAGGFYVENNSLEGKNKNRRVEIVTIGIDAEAFRKVAANY